MESTSLIRSDQTGRLPYRLRIFPRKIFHYETYVLRILDILKDLATKGSLSKKILKNYPTLFLDKKTAKAILPKACVREISSVVACLLTPDVDKTQASQAFHLIGFNPDDPRFLSAFKIVYHPTLQWFLKGPDEKVFTAGGLNDKEVMGLPITPFTNLFRPLIRQEMQEVIENLGLVGWIEIPEKKYGINPEHKRAVKHGEIHHLDAAQPVLLVFSKEADVLSDKETQEVFVQPALMKGRQEELIEKMCLFIRETGFADAHWGNIRLSADPNKLPVFVLIDIEAFGLHKYSIKHCARIGLEKFKNSLSAAYEKKTLNEVLLLLQREKLRITDGSVGHFLQSLEGVADNEVATRVSQWLDEVGLSKHFQESHRETDLPNVYRKVVKIVSTYVTNRDRVRAIVDRHLQELEGEEEGFDTPARTATSTSSGSSTPFRSTSSSSSTPFRYTQSDETPPIVGHTISSTSEADALLIVERHLTPSTTSQDSSDL